MWMVVYVHNPGIPEEVPAVVNPPTGPDFAKMLAPKGRGKVTPGTGPDAVPVGAAAELNSFGLFATFPDAFSAF